MGSISSIKDGVIDLLETITTPAPGIQNLHRERPPVTTMAEFLKAFRTAAPGGGWMVNAWIMEPPRSDMDLTAQAGRVVTTWTIPIIGYMSASDRKHNKGVNVSDLMDQILEQIQIKLLQDTTGFTLGGSVITVPQVRISQSPPAFFGETLTYIGNAEIDALTRTQF